MATLFPVAGGSGHVSIREVRSSELKKKGYWEVTTMTTRPKSSLDALRWVGSQESG